MSKSALGLIASEYAAGGAAVLPLHNPRGDGCDCGRRNCPNPGKHPRTLHGLTDATTDPETVDRWWTMWPEANIGVRPAGGQFVLDVDPRNGGDVQLAAMLDHYGPLPATRTALTGGGGWHFWFHGHGDLVGRLAVGIDVKTHDGYLVGPPSIHASGALYAWTNLGPIAEAPDYLRDLLVRKPRPVPASAGPASQAVVDGLVRTVREAHEGNRNNSLHWACCRAAEKGVDTALLIEAAVERGLDRVEAERTADSAARAVSGGAA